MAVIAARTQRVQSKIGNTNNVAAAHTLAYPRHTDFFAPTCGWPERTRSSWAASARSSQETCCAGDGPARKPVPGLPATRATPGTFLLFYRITEMNVTPFQAPSPLPQTDRPSLRMCAAKRRGCRSATCFGNRGLHWARWRGHGVCCRERTDEHGAAQASRDSVLQPTSQAQLGLESGDGVSNRSP